MAETFENFEGVLPDWTEDEAEESLAQAVNFYEKQEERKKCFFVEDNLENILEQSQSSATKRNTKWVVKVFQGYASCATFLFLPHFDVISDLSLNRRTATWNLFVK